MKFISFTIKNFKGIEAAQLSLQPGGANVFTLIGLNESGKTTFLEAISVFGQYSEESDETKSLYSGKTTNDAPSTFIPKHRTSNFSGKTQLIAKIEFENEDLTEIIKSVEAEMKCEIDVVNLAKKFDIVRSYEFENSDYKTKTSTWNVGLKVKPLKSKKKYSEASSSDEIWKCFVKVTSKKIPQILYFPTFLFAQPDSIELNPTAETPINRQYREIINNIAKSCNPPLDVQKHIVDRIMSPEVPGAAVLQYFNLAKNKREQIDAVLNELSSHLTKTVFERWSKIFGGDFSGREIVLRLQAEPTSGEEKILLSFLLKDGTSTYEIFERSLGFRWFFSFLLFTIYRITANSDRPVLFLLDEPASNLHSKAQVQLLESFPRIASGSNQIIYSTHSHYMINPAWLDQAHIVSNQAVDYDIAEIATEKRQPTNILISKYREFVGKFPNRLSYFQPVLDKLNVVPSKIDPAKPSVIMEGKGDYLIVEYGRRIINEVSSSFSIIPTRGAAGMDEILGLLKGWGVPFSICLDDDAEGRKAAKSYIDDWGLSDQIVYTLARVSKDLEGRSIEGFLEHEDLKLIEQYFGLQSRPTKSQIRLFFSENLSKHTKQSLSQKYIERVESFERVVSDALKES